MLERLRTMDLYFLTPVARRPAWQTDDSMRRTQRVLYQYGIQHRSYAVIGNSNLPRARNELIAHFLASECTHAMLIDDDMVWEPNDLIRLLASPEPLIAGVGKKKVPCPDQNLEGWCVAFLADGGTTLHMNGTGAIEVAGVGTGFMRVHRSVFEAMAQAHPEWKLTGLPRMEQAVKDQYYRFFRFPDDDAYGEDTWFCKCWRDLGGKVWIDPEISIGHVGEFVFKGDIRALFQKRAEPAERL